MGNQPSAPKSGTEFQVIGAGLSRTGTASFSEALRILLGGPVYHCGTQTSIGEPVEIKSWVKLMSHWPPVRKEDEQIIYDVLKDRLIGYAAVTDTPANGFVKELLELHPNAKVICTVRDPASWAKSIAVIQTATTMWFLRGVLLPIPGLRHFVALIDGLAKQWQILYGEGPVIQAYDRHIELLKGIVPKDQLVFFDVREGWEPLCKALGKPVPKDIPFPRINDSEAIERLSKRVIKRGLLRWAVVIVTCGLAFIPFIWI